jgi:hypothetical protein
MRVSAVPAGTSRRVVLHVYPSVETLGYSHKVPSGTQADVGLNLFPRFFHRFNRSADVRPVFELGFPLGTKGAAVMF